MNVFSRTHGAGLTIALALLAGTVLMLSPPLAAQQAGAGSITGQVRVLVDGESPEGIELGLVETEHRSLVNRAGAFELSNIPAGSYTLQLSYKGVELGQRAVEVRAGERTEVVLRPGAPAPETGIHESAQRPEVLERLLALLVERGVLSEAEVGQIRQEAEAERAASRVELGGQAIAYEPTLPITDDDVSVQVLPFGVESWDGSSRFRIRGRMQLDGEYASMGDDIQNVARQGNEFPTYGLFLRRVRLGAAGIMRQIWEWQVEADFAENELDLANVYIALLQPSGRLAAGYFKEPFGMEYATSSRYISFIERSAASDAYKVNREPGIMYETLYRNWYAGVGLFGSGLERDRDLRKGWAVSGRVSVAPYLEGSDYVHLGAGFNRRVNSFDFDDEEWTEVRLRTREGVRAIDMRLIGRDDLVAVEDFTRSNVEFAAGFGPWWIQSEYLQVDINLDRDALVEELGGNATDLDALKQHGWYVQTGFFLTGESRNYRAFSGDFGPQSPRQNVSRDGGIGAFEVALRYSSANSLEHTRQGRGQAMDHYTLGLNWYLSPEVALKANLIYLEGERDEFVDDAWIFGARLQYIF
jgi:phosphate-selective porin OprO and OprP